MTWDGTVILIASCAAALFAGPTLWLTYLAYRRDTERSDVDWQVKRIEEGDFAAVNTGRDDAYEVLVEMWTTTEIESATAEKVEAGERVRVRLPRRAAGEAEPSTVPRSMFEDFPDQPPELNPLMGAMAEKIMADWERGKRLKDEAMESQAEMEKLERESQVQVRIMWRSKRGVWKEHTEKTG